MNKKIILALSLIVPSTHASPDRSYVHETIAVVATTAGAVIVGVLGWKALSYSQQQADKDSIATVATIDPDKELNDITALFEQARTTKQSIGELLAHYCATHNISAHDICSKLTSYTQKADAARAKLTANCASWKHHNHELAPLATSTLSDPRLQEKIQALHRMCSTLAHEKEYAHLYCAYHSVNTAAYFNTQKQFYLIHAANAMMRDIEKLKSVMQKLETLNAYDAEQSKRYANFKNILKNKIYELTTTHDRTVNKKEYIEQKSSYFIFEQQQKMLVVEQERVSIEKMKAEKELKETQFKLAAQKREWDTLHTTIHNLKQTNQHLVEARAMDTKSLNALRFELERLKAQCAALENQKTKLQAELKSATVNNNKLSEQHKKVEKELIDLKNKIATLQRRIENPPFNPNGPAMVAWLKQSIVELMP